MKLPFTTEQFLDIFSQYNRAVFPAQIVFYLMALMALYFTFRQSSNSAKIISSILAFFWLWMGVVYHLIFFTTINKAAYLFGALFMVQSFLLLYSGTIRGNLSFSFSKNIYTITGSIFILYALVIYPFLGYINGHIYPSAPTFGLPCPTTIFTVGLFLFSKKKFPYYLVIIPLLWSLVGFTAAIQLGISEDTGLLVAGILTTIMILLKNKKA